VEKHDNVCDVQAVHTISRGSNKVELNAYVSKVIIMKPPKSAKLLILLKNTTHHFWVHELG